MTDKVPTLPADVTPEQLADAIMPGFSRTADEATAAAAATSAPHAGAGGNAGAGAAGAASDADNAGSDRAGESDAVAGVEVDGEGEPGDGRQVSAEELCVVCGAVRRRLAVHTVVTHVDWCRLPVQCKAREAPPGGPCQTSCEEEGEAQGCTLGEAARGGCVVHAHVCVVLVAPWLDVVWSAAPAGKRTEESVLVAPDPNLWLPRHLRPATGKRGRRRRKLNQSGGGAQGAGDLTASDADALDAAKHADERLAVRVWALCLCIFSTRG